MTKIKTQATIPAVVVTPKADAQALDNVISLLDEAGKAAVAMHTKARLAATAACAGNFLTDTPADRATKIIALYMPHLTEKSVKEAFSAAVSLLVADKDVRIASTSVETVFPTKDYPQGKTVFKNPEVLPPVAEKGEILPEKKSVTTMSAEDAVAKLPIDQLKAAATAVRQLIGTARAPGAGRKASTEGRRAPFMEEFAAAWKDAGLKAQLVAIIRASGEDVVPLKGERKLVKQGAEPSIGAQLAK
jgi:hypothetical protein